MIDNVRNAEPGRATVRETGAVMLAIGGLAAAFGAAACCALPMLLSSVGLGSAWLFGIAILAAPNRLALIAAAAVCLVGAGIILACHRRAVACAPGTVCAHRAVAPLVMGFLVIGTALAVAGYLYA